MCQHNIILEFIPWAIQWMHNCTFNDGALVLRVVVGLYIQGRGRNCTQRVQSISVNVLRRNQAEFGSGNTMRSGKTEASKILLCWILTFYAVLQKVIPSFYDY